MILSLALRLLRGSGRRGYARLGLLVLGTAVGSMCLLLAIGIPNALRASYSRTQQREPQSARSASQTVGYYQPFDRRVGSAIIRGFFLDASGATPPPGVSAIPGPGQMVVSPALQVRLADDAAVRARLPGSVVGVISPTGLSDPDELFAWIGSSRSSMGTGQLRLEGFGNTFTTTSDIDPGQLTSISFAFLVLVGVPLAVYFGVVARLSSTSRDRRVAALRLAGMSSHDASRLVVVESVLAAAGGVGLGLVILRGSQGVIAGIGVAGRRWFAGDLGLNPFVMVLTAIGIVVVAAAIGRVGARTALKNSLAVRRESVIRPPRALRWIPLVVGAGGLSGIVLKSVLSPGKELGNVAQLELMGALLLTGIGVAMAPGVLGPAFARWLGNHSSRPDFLLATRRLEAAPAGITRVVASLVVVVFLVGAATGVLRDAQALTLPGRAIEEYSVTLGDLPPNAAEGILGSPVVSTPVWLTAGERNKQPVTVAFATCASMEAFAHSPLDGCRDGQVSQLDLPVAAGSADQGALQPVQVPLRDRKPLELSPVVRLALPAATDLAPDLMVPPDQGTPSSLPSDAQLVFSSGTAPTSIAKVDELFARVAPSAPITYLNDNLEARTQVQLFERLLFVALGLGLIVGLAAFVVATIDDALERRANETALLIVGVPKATLRRAHGLQTGLMMLLGGLLAIVFGALADQAIARSGGYVRAWDWGGLQVPMLIALAAVLVSGVAAAFVTRPRVEVALIRRQ